MKHVLFLINYYNDVDHTAPLMEELLDQGFSVSLICLTRYDILSDVRITALAINKRFSVHSFSLLPRNTGISNEKTGSISVINKLFRELTFNVLTALAFILRYKFSTIFFTWGRPRAKGLQRQIFAAARLMNIPTICVPHGQNIYLNYDVNEYLEKSYQNTGRWPDFSDRNEFTHYVVQTARHRDQHIAWGMDPKKVIALGSLRFDPQWVQKNQTLYTPIKSRHIANFSDTVRIVFFLPHWRYNVDKTLTFSLITRIANEPNIHMIIKGHTRGDSVDTRFIEQLTEHSNVEVNSPYESTPLIAWANIIINFGSSIAIEAIVARKHVIYPEFLHRNKTIFDICSAVHTANSIESVLKIIGLISKGQLPSAPKKAVDELLQTEVYGGLTPHSVSKRYAEMLL